WAGILDWCTKLPAASLGRSVDTLTLYLRALGEQSRLNEMVEVFGKYRAALSRMQKNYRDLARMYVYAFAGKTDIVEKLFSGSLVLYPADIRETWIGTSLLASGNIREGTRRLQELQQTASPLSRHAVEQRLSRPVVHAPLELIPPSVKIL